MKNKIFRKKIFIPLFKTYLLEFKLRWKRILIIIIIFLIFSISLILFYPYHFDVGEFLQDELGYFKIFITFISSFFFSDIICDEYNKKTGYIVFPKISKFTLIAGKYFSNLSVTIMLIVFYYLILNISAVLVYDTVIIEILLSFGIAILYTITLSIIILFLSAILPNANLISIFFILISFIGFPMMEQVLTVINQEIEPIFSLNYIGNLIVYTIPGGLINNRRWTWVYYAGDTLPPVKMWLTPTIGIGILIPIIYIVIFMFLALVLIERKEF